MCPTAALQLSILSIDNTGPHICDDFIRDMLLIHVFLPLPAYTSYGKSQYTKAAHKISNFILKWKILSNLFFLNGSLPFILTYVKVSKPTGISNLFLTTRNILAQKKTREVHTDI